MTAVLGPGLQPGVYQLRVIPVGPAGALGSFSDALTLVLTTADRPTITSPREGQPVAPGAAITVAWTAVAGATAYGFEFTGPDRQFANPTGATPDSVNGFGGAGGAFLVTATGLSGPVPPGVPPGRYQLRVIGLNTGGVVGSFSDAVTLVVP